MKLKPNCPNCGAPVTGGTCAYCGTEFDFDGIKEIKLTYAPYRIETLVSSTVVPLEMIHGGSRSALDYAEHNMAMQFAKDILKYADIETWIDPVTMSQRIGAKVKVIMPQ